MMPIHVRFSRATLLNIGKPQSGIQVHGLCRALQEGHVKEQIPATGAGCLPMESAARNTASAQCTKHWYAATFVAACMQQHSRR
jgi:hypothetical protein